MGIEDTLCPGDLPERYLTYHREPGSFTKENFCVCTVPWGKEENKLKV